MAGLGCIFVKCHWSVWAMAPITFAFLYRKRGSFYYRSFVTICCLAVAAVYGIIASLVLPLFGKAGLINWSVAKVYYHLSKTFLGVSVTIKGKENLIRSEPAVFVCNHQSSMDIFAMSSVFPKSTSVVAKKAIKYYPFLGWFMTLSNAIFLDRKNRDSAIKEAQKAADDIHSKKLSVWLFPEGTRGREGEASLLPFKKGAFYMAVQAQVPIVPVVVANYSHIYSSKNKYFKAGSVTVEVLPPVSTVGIKAESEAVDQLATHVRELMLKSLENISHHKAH